MKTKIGSEILGRRPDSNKYSNGHCLIIGGSADYSGAPYLAARAAYRTGCGIVTLAVPDIIAGIMRIKCAEEIILSLPDQKGYISAAAAKKLDEYIQERRVASVVVGPGVSRSKAAGDFIKAFLPALTGLPVIVDADAIFYSRELFLSGGNIVITPHEGELSRFLKTRRGKISSNREGYAKAAAKKLNGCCVLKGRNTVITDGSKVISDRTGTPVLATAGSGDVLSGILGALFAQAVSKKTPCVVKPIEIAALGVKIHSAAGNLAAKKRKFGVTAADIIEEIPEAVK